MDTSFEDWLSELEKGQQPEACDMNNSDSETYSS